MRPVRPLRPLRLTLGFNTVASLLLLSGCGNGRLGTDDDDQIQRESLATPMDYRIEDPACQESAGSPTIGAQPVYVWNGEAGVPETYPFSVSGMRTVSSDQIEATFYGYHQRTTETCLLNDDGSFDCSKADPEVITREEHLKLCRPNGTYGRDSIEGVTLASIANIERASSIYQGLANAKDQSKTILLVLPNYESARDYRNPENGKEYHEIYSVTDNAAFAPIKGKDGDADTLLFLVYPRSEETVKDPRWADIRLWEIPWVMAHEYSHQIFYSHYANYHADTARSRSRPTASGFADLDPSEDVWKREPEFKFPTRSNTAPRLSLTNQAREAGVREALGALNEGFADLFAAQMLDGKKDHTLKLPCFEKSRDILTSSFEDGTAKILTVEAHGDFFSDVEIKAEGDCATSFQDTHHIGAIFAYGINEILMAGVDANADATTRAGLVLKWLDTFNAERAKVTSISPEDIWLLAVKAALQTAQGPTETLLSSQCSITKDVFPIYVDRLFLDAGAPSGFACAP